MPRLNLRWSRVFVSGIGISFIFWIVESAIEFSVFNKFNSLTESIVYPDKIALWMRLLAISLFISFDHYVQKAKTDKENLQVRETEKRERLEKLLEAQAVEIRSKVEALAHEKLELEKAEEKIQALASIDPLTSIYNRHKFNEIFEQELKRIKRNPGNLTLVFCDIDHFKEINDCYGYYVGDEVLRTFAFVIGKNIRESDIFSRWGGEEFAILLTNSDIEGAQTFSEHLVKTVQEYPFEDVGTLSMSIGIAQYKGGDDAASLVKRADEALYEAKVRGRNCVVGAS